jgi:hypothetical protein
MTGRKVQVNINGAHSDALASFDGDLNKSIILIGTRNYVTPHNVSISLNNIPGSLSLNGKVHIRAELIRNAMVLMSPEVVVAGDYSVTGGSVSLSLPTLVPKASYMVYVSPATSDAPKTSYESESLSASYTSGRTHKVFDDATASGGKASALEATANGDYVEYCIPSPGAGAYNLSAILNRQNSHGFMQLYINGQSVCPPEDEYGADVYYEHDFGNIEVSSGDLYLKFVVVGQNPASSGKLLVFDRFDLTKLGNGENIAVDEMHRMIQEQFSLDQNYPNPFNPKTKIMYSVPRTSHVSLKIYDLLGKKVVTLYEGIRKEGNYTAIFDGEELASGIYFYQLIAENFVDTKKLILQK